MSDAVFATSHHCQCVLNLLLHTSKVKSLFTSEGCFNIIIFIVWFLEFLWLNSKEVSAWDTGLNHQGLAYSFFLAMRALLRSFKIWPSFSLMSPISYSSTISSCFERVLCVLLTFGQPRCAWSGGSELRLASGELGPVVRSATSPPRQWTHRAVHEALRPNVVCVITVFCCLMWSDMFF